MKFPQLKCPKCGGINFVELGETKYGKTMYECTQCLNDIWEEELKSIDHPAHYNSKKYECIGVMEEIFGANATQHFCLLNAFKYLWRCKSKHQTPEEDIKKARWYLDKWISLQKNFPENLDKE